VTQVLDRNGKPLTDDSGKVVDTGNHCKADAIPAGVANTLANMMLDVVSDGTGRKAAIPGQSIAGKTGTIQGDNSATFVGITPKYAVSVMYYNPKGVENVGGHGGGVPAQIFHDAMAPVIGNQPNVPFPAPDPAVQAGTRGSGFVPPPAAGQSPPAGQDNGGATTNGTTNGGGNGGGNGIRDGGTGFGGTGFGGNPNGRRGGGGRGNDGGGDGGGGGGNG
jgi:membrane peptidoglycan carboxypeptidase